MIEFTRPVWQVLNERQLRDLWYAQGQSLINLLDSVVGVGKWVTRSLPSGIRVDWKSPEAGHHDNWCVVRFRQEMPSGTPYCSLDVKLTEEYRRRGLSRATLESMKSMARTAGDLQGQTGLPRAGAGSLAEAAPWGRGGEVRGRGRVRLRVPCACGGNGS